MGIQAVISQFPKSRFYDQPDIVYSVDVTPYLAVIKTLVELADIVNSNPTRFDDTAKTMAYFIEIIKEGAQQQLEGK